MSEPYLMDDRVGRDDVAALVGVATIALVVTGWWLAWPGEIAQPGFRIERAEVEQACVEWLTVDRIGSVAGLDQRLRDFDIEPKAALCLARVLYSLAAVP